MEMTMVMAVGYNVDSVQAGFEGSHLGEGGGWFVLVCMFGRKL